MDVARRKYRSKLDMSDAFKQVQNEPEDIWKTAFVNVFGMFKSNVMTQGDCNSPATFQRVMTLIFQDIIGKYVHVYVDDIFIFSDTLEDHERHVREVFSRLRKFVFYLKSDKCELFAKSIDCLGHLIDDDGMHADKDKMSKIREWRT